jgi:flagellar motor switch protein FliM
VSISSDRAAGVPTQRGSRVLDEPQVYDFRRPLTLARDTARRLEMGFERFARMWGTQLTSRLRETCSVVLDDVALRTYEDFITTLPNPTAVVLCTIEQTRQTAIVQFPVGAAMVWVDYVFGGTGIGDDRERELTEIELVVARDLTQRALDDLAYSFASIVPISVTMRSVQYNPQFVQAAGAAEPVIVATFTLTVGERSDTATLMMPADLMLVEPTADEVDADRVAEEERIHQESRERLESLAQGIPVDVSVRFVPAVVHPRDVVNLSVGDVLPLHHPASAPLDVVVDGVRLARAAAGSQGSRLACKVVTVEEYPR